MSVLESCAVCLALSYVLLAIWQLRVCWIAAIASAALYILIFWQVQLYLEAILQVFYIVMAVYGWAAWRPNEAQSVAPIRTWPFPYHGAACCAVLIVSIALGTITDNLTDAASPYVDAATTISALLATWMVAQRLLENWLYWIAIDLASVGLYLSRDLSLTAGLFAAYVLLAGLGYRTWRRQWCQQSA